MLFYYYKSAISERKTYIKKNISPVTVSAKAATCCCVDFLEFG